MCYTYLGLKKHHTKGPSLESILKWLRPAPPIEEIQDQKEVSTLYKYWRFRIMYSMFIGYAMYYFTRKSFIFTMPALMSSLGFLKTDMGIVTSVFAITYGISKFLSGILADRSNPRFFMAVGLMLTGVCNICFAYSGTLGFPASITLVLFAICWGFNGLFQGFGAPPCAYFMTKWYSQSERGSWWSVWNLSHNVGAMLIPFIVGFGLYFFNWRFGMYIPGVICIFGGLFLLNRLRDTPESMGLPPVEKFRNDFVDNKNFGEGEKLTANQILFKYVLKNKFIWALAFANFFVYVVRQAVTDWTALFLIEAKGYSMLMAYACIWWLEVGGFFGSLAAGWVSDKVFKAKRGPVNVIFAAGMLGAVFLFWTIGGRYAQIDSALVAAIGFCLFGPQMLIGVAAAELSHKTSAATSNGFVGTFGYLGAACAGWPLAKITQVYGWNGFFWALAICGTIAVAVLLPLWSVSKTKQAVPTTT